MFRPNLNCQIHKTTGKSDVYGMPVPGPKKKERCAIVKLDVINEKSSVRADTSASRGNAREFQADIKFLLTKNTVAQIDDMLIFEGQEYRIASKFPRHDVQGRLDHYEITCTYWSAR